MINQMIVGERLEKFDGLRLVIVAPSCGLGLAGPKYGGVLGMPLFKRLPVLRVPRIVERPHEFKIVLCHVILPTSDSAGSPKHVLVVSLSALILHPCSSPPECSIEDRPSRTQLHGSLFDARNIVALRLSL